ncbi:8-amino-7-oxononanoate synthase [Arthrobacter sp. MYb227]|uniref:aminotransferase class I/II-fold pyridoxal phosphate-dependent enzyme n=1 Tax=Arthrobacter sp. MYb227 TaxID=1848601 RepID=UPI000CFAB759|nr:aminotransferase class I/II-fold pyridoxal phosphate-dependent enzyme [Arthrobacter sp. MYb227]PQZ93777.1 8-amino-7-oxononanoate synthase [Arthrobacter sp. MYb227]
MANPKTAKRLPDVRSSEVATHTAPKPGAWERWFSSRAAVRVSRNLERNDTSRTALFDLASNDYLGLSRHPLVQDAAATAAGIYGAGAAASRVATGTMPVHRDLEEALCSYTDRDQALVFSSGYTANLGILGALGGPGSLMILDAHAHASLIDGARISGAQVKISAHNSVPDLKRLLDENLTSDDFKPRVVVVIESIYSVLGDSAPLREFAQTCADYGAQLVIDEAHSFGATHRGSATRAAGLAKDSSVIITATLSKSLGSQGGAVLFGGARASLLRNHLANTARTFLFDTALAPPAAAAAHAALDLASPERIARLHENARLMCAGLAEYESLLNRIEPGAGAVQSLRMHSPEKALRVSAQLRARGIAVACFRPPSVPDGISRLRMSAHAQHSPEEVVAAMRTIAQTIVEVES